MVAQPNLVYDEYYFNGAPYGYTDYASPLTYLSERPAQLVANYARHLSTSGKTVLVVGCAFGMTVHELRKLGVQAWGMDVSEYAVSMADPEVAPYLLVGDARDPAAWSGVKSLAGLRGNGRFNVTITEDMLACLSNSEAQTVAANARANSQSVFHLVTDNPHWGEWYNENSPQQWKALLGSDRVITRFTWAVL